MGGADDSIPALKSRAVFLASATTMQIRKLQFPGFSRGVAPSTTINHGMIPFIEKFRSIREAVKQFGRI